mmetsp:Transcript_26303/g.52449  ORF Transcript_26303/g.52449 Transcript_26303/m.52449 type:complete len:315 (-) Transcript_26303:246-1190(-)
MDYRGVKLLELRGVQRSVHRGHPEHLQGAVPRLVQPPAPPRHQVRPPLVAALDHIPLVLHLLHGVASCYKLLRGDNRLLVRQGQHEPLDRVREQLRAHRGRPRLHRDAEGLEDGGDDGGPERSEGVVTAQVGEAYRGLGRGGVHEGEGPRRTSERLQKRLRALARLEAPLPHVHDLVHGREHVGEPLGHLFDVGLVPGLLRACHSDEPEERVYVPRHLLEVIAPDDGGRLRQDRAYEIRPLPNTRDGVRDACKELDQVHLLGRKDVASRDEGRRRRRYLGQELAEGGGARLAHVDEDRARLAAEGGLHGCGARA